MKNWLGALCLFIGSFSFFPAQACVLEVEPSNAPQSATTIPELPGCAKGVSANGDLDWLAFDIKIAGLWRLKLEAPPGREGAMTLARLPRSGGAAMLLWRGDVEQSEGLIESPPLVLTQGQWLVAVAGAYDPMRWRLYLEAVDPIQQDDGPFENAFAARLVGPATATEWIWNVTSDRQKGLWSLGLRAPPDQQVGLALIGPDGDLIFDDNSQDRAGLHSRVDLALTPGVYRFRLRGLGEGVPAVLTATQSGEGGQPIASEPDNSVADAHPLTLDVPITGRLVNSDGTPDTDFFTFTAPGAGERVEIDLDFPASAEVSAVLADALGTDITDIRRLEESGSLGPYSLPPGRYVLKVSGNLGNDLRYSIEVRATSSQPEGLEAEPNDRPDYASLVQAGTSLAGDATDRTADYVLIDAPGPDLSWWTIRAASPKEFSLRLFFSKSDLIPEVRSAQGEELVLSRFPLAPGPNLIRIAGTGSWTLSSTPTGPPAILEEREPNDDAIRATELLSEKSFRFRLDRPGDSDSFSLSLMALHRVRMQITAPAAANPSAELVHPALGQGIRLAFETDPAAPGVLRAEWTGQLPEGTSLVTIKGKKAVDVEGTVLAAVDPPLDPPVQTSDITSNIVADTEVAAGDPRSQRLPVELTFSQLPAVATPYTLAVWVAQEDWRIEGLSETVQAIRGEVSLSLRLMAPPFLPVGAQTAWAVALIEPVSGATIALASGKVEARSSVPPRDPVIFQALPDTLVGALDAARTSFGAVISPASAEGLFDGVQDGAAVEMQIGKPIEVVLSGEKATSVLGLIMTPPVVGDARKKLRHYRIEASDGGAFIPVHEGVLEPSPRPQALTFDTPITAKVVRFTPLEAWGGSSVGQGTLSGLSVLVPAETRPDVFDIARADLGGHLIWTTPTISPVIGEAGSWPGSAIKFRGEQGANAEWVIGFLNARAANVHRIDLSYASPIPAAGRATEVRISGTLAGPSGRWQDIGSAIIDPATAAGSLVLDSPKWVRALRFTANGPDATSAYLPVAIAVWETRSDPGGATILGEWGADARSAVFESRMIEGEVSAGVPGGTSRESAVDLPIEALASGRVDLGTDGLWFRLGPSRTATRLVINLSGKGIAPDLFDADGTAVPLSLDGDRHWADLAAFEPPFLLHLPRPQDSVVVVWDTSGSVASSEAAIFAAIQDIIGGLRRNHLSMNLVPFRAAYRDGAGTPWLKSFVTSAGEARAALNAYAITDESSNAEAALIVAARALAQEPGRHLIVLITDAVFSSSLSARAWAEIDAANARIYSLQVPSGANGQRAAAQTTLMQDWANYTGGLRRLFGGPADARAAFGALMDDLDKPLPFELSWQEEQGARALARLRVLPQKKETASALAANAIDGPAIEIIVDASGSMLQRVGNVRRIDLAKSVLDRLLKVGLPEGTRVGLRQFGSGGKGSCDGSVLLPLGPLDPAVAAMAVAEIKAVDGAKTAIAASLKEAGRNLLGRTGRQTIVLITDGEETCGGDPRAEISALKAAGLDVRLSIVGFDVSDAKLVQDFRAWAEIGGGDYFVAADFEGLAAALSAAVASEFRVIDSAGKEVSRGLVGGPTLELPEGQYRLVLDGVGPTFGVNLRSGELAEIAMPPTKP